MANLDAPRGYRAVANGVAGTTPRLNAYSVASGAAVFEGDIVALNASALLLPYTTTDALAGDIVGVAAHHGAASATEVLVYDDPAQEYEVQSDDNSLTVVLDYTGLMFKPIIATGNTTTLQSKHELDGSSATSIFGTAATNVTPIMVLRKSAAINNDANVSFTRYIVKINSNAHLFGGGGVSAIGGGIG